MTTAPAHQHCFTREDNDGPFVCACGATRSGPLSLLPQSSQRIRVHHESHAQIGADHDAYLHALRDETGRRGLTSAEIGRAYHKFPNERAMFLLNQQLAERRPDLPGIDTVDELRYLAVDICGWPLKRQVEPGRKLDEAPDRSGIARRQRPPWKEALDRMRLQEGDGDGGG